MKDILKWSVIGGLFLVPFLTLYVENDYFFPFITGKNFWFRIIVDFTLVAYVLLALYEPKYRPQWSWILGGSAALLVVMFFANLLGEHPQSSFWSNFERMDGYVSLVHTYAYMLVLGSMLQTQESWKWLLNTSLVVAVLVAIGGVAQYFEISAVTNMFNIGANTGRVDSTLGNAAYMAVYMLFHIFIAIWLLAKARTPNLQLFYASLLPFFVFILFATGTRGTTIALVGGLAVTGLYVLLFGRGKNAADYRNYALGTLAMLAMLVVGFFAFKDTDIIQSQPSLARIASINLEDDLRIRSIIWGMTLEGVKERPVLGWGQSNFNYIFNQQYDPRLYEQEQWFDRAHNIFMDWLVSGGILGLLAYLSIFAACVYYLFIRPLQQPDDQAFTLLERGILLGLLAGYFTHNLVVFDNIISYIFFAVILGLIHARVGTPIASIAKKKIDETLIAQAALPVGIAVFAAVVYFVHAPGMAAAGDVIKAFRAMQPSVEQGVQRPPEGPEAMLKHFNVALERESFAHQEITEQIAQQSMNMARQPQVPAEVRDAFASTTQQQLDKLVADKPGDARVHVFIASYYRATNQLEKAAQEMSRARELSPDKQAIINQQGFIELSRNDQAAANAFFKESFELDEDNLEAREYYAAGLLRVGDINSAVALMDSVDARKRFAQSDFLLGAARQAGASELLDELYAVRNELDPTNAQNWASRAFLQFEAGQSAAAVGILEDAAKAAPDFAVTARCIIDNINAGVAEPQTDC